MNAPIAEESRIIVFDDECPLCSRWVRFVIKRDAKGLFKFTGIGSASARIFVKDSSLLTAQTVILVAPEGTYTKSSAILYILERLSGCGWLSRALRLIPRRIRDTAYDFVARHRKALFRRNRQSCRLPSGASERFL
jgi:predicted DCC family thiol-disulfide oxidoreductase YuxK